MERRLATIMAGDVVGYSAQMTQTQAEEAVAWFNRAVEKDPEYGRAHAWRRLGRLVGWLLVTFRVRRRGVLSESRMR